MNSRKRIRVGAVSYLNTKPLVYQFGRFAPQAELVFDLPSRLADGLATGRFDVALIPSIEFLQDPGYVIVSDACIGCRGDVLSVKLLSRVPLEQIRTLALDEGSRTSAALVKILLQQRFDIRPQTTILPIGGRSESSQADAVLLIGDRAIHPPVVEFPHRWDLGREWRSWSGLPFVFAMWTARSGVDLLGVETALADARDLGVAHLEEIAAAEAEAVSLPVEAALCYLRDNLHFSLGAEERRGLKLFARHAAAMGLAPPREELEFDDCQIAG